MHFLGIAGMPRRIPDYPDIYWAWNYVSSVGSLVSVFGILVFLVIIYDLFSSNNLFFQVSNVKMCFILNLRYSKLINEFSKLDFKFTRFWLNLFFGKEKKRPDFYVFIKYNFFRHLLPRYGYIYLDRCMIKAL